jgi:putative hemolysin
MTIGLEIVIILLLIVINGLFSMSELALVSVRRARLAVLERKGVPGAAAARALSDDPQRFLPTVQVGITLVSVLTGVFGGARIAIHLQVWLEQFPDLAPFAESLALGVVVILTTYLTLVLGELVPKQLALRSPELVAARVARPVAVLATIVAPAVWLLGISSTAVMRLFGLSRVPRQSVTEEELKALDLKIDMARVNQELANTTVRELVSQREQYVARKKAEIDEIVIRAAKALKLE